MMVLGPEIILFSLQQSSKINSKIIVMVEYFCLFVLVISYECISLEVYFAKKTLKLFASVNYNIGKAPYKLFDREF